MTMNDPLNKKRILVIPDTQVKEGVSLDHLTACGHYIVDKQPDIIVHIGDHFDMPSLSSYSPKKEIEGQRVLHDIQSGIEGMQALMKPIEDYNWRQMKNKKKKYNPELHFTLGNHEQRLKRYIDDHPSLDGILNYPEDFELESFGWNVHEFLKPVELEGFLFAHYFYAAGSGRPYGGNAKNILGKVKCSFVQGHRQGLDIAIETANSNRKYWGIIAGSFYDHEEGYIGHQVQNHWQGVVMLNEAHDGDCEITTTSLNYLKERYL